MKVLEVASRVTALPGLGLVARAANQLPTSVALDGYRAAQRLAQRAARDVAAMVGEGWSERQAADLLDTYLRDHGVRSFFHKAFAWVGERTRFAGVRTYFDYLPSARVVRPGEVFILDVAPIVGGYIVDIGYTAALGENAELAKAQAFLADVRAALPGLFAAAGATGGGVWRAVDARFKAAGFDNVHALYPFSVLGHRVHRVRSAAPALSFLNFGWQSYWEFLARGLFGQLLNGQFTGDLTGLWAIEPHVGAPGFGAKFEELLVVDRDGARWLDAAPAD